MNPSRERAWRSAVLALDTLLVLMAMGLAWGCHAALRPSFPQLHGPPPFNEYALLAYLALPVFLGCIASLGLDRVVERPRSEFALLRDLLTLHIAVLLGLALIVLVTQTVVNRSLIALFLGFTFVLLFAERAILGRWQQLQHSMGHSRRRLLLVGSPSGPVEEFIEHARREPLPPEFVGFVDEPEPSAPARRERLQRKGGLLDLEQILHREAIDQVLFFPPYHSPARVSAALAACETVGVPASFAVDLTRPSAAKPHMELVCGNPFVSYEVSPRPPGSLLWKHALDFVGASMGLLLISPLLAVVAALILVTMGRPVLFTQDRAGRNGRRFRMFKFRTMIANAEAQRDGLLAKNMMSGPVFKLARDPRVTRLGSFLRRTSLDELPQLLNVVLGDMSLVGPRPLPCHEQENIRGWHRRRLSMKPGLTGLWQVSGRNTIDFDSWMKLDLRYVDTWSLHLDLRILLQTLPAVVRGRGAC